MSWISTEILHSGFEAALTGVLISSRDVAWTYCIALHPPFMTRPVEPMLIEVVCHRVNRLSI